MQPRSAGLISILLETVFPLAGYFFLSWSLTDIILFYSLDILAFEYNFNLKSWYIIRKPKYYKGFEPQYRIDFFKNALLSFFSFIGLLASLYFLLLAFHSYFTSERALHTAILDFFYNNYFLLPLLFLARHMQSYMQFIKPHLYVETQLYWLRKRHYKARILLFCGVIILFSIPLIIKSQLLIISLMALGKFCYDLYFHYKQNHKLK